MKKIRLFSAIAIALFLIFTYFQSISTYLELKLAPYTGDFYAIRLNDNSYLYGKVTGTDLNWVRLKDVHYFQTVLVNETETKNLIAQSSNILISPKNFMLVNRDNISLIEKVGDGARLLEIINQK